MEATKQRLTGEEIDKRMDKIDSLFHELTQSKLTIMGREYDLSEWMTLTDYAKKHNLSVARVQTWISRGVVPAGFAIVVPELNHLKLIKDQPYETRTIRRSADK